MIDERHDTAATDLLDEVTDVISDEELTALALAADRDAAVAHDAVPLDELIAGGSAPLPAWYMPAPMLRHRVVNGWRRHAVILVIASFVAINAYGLCNTYGQLPFGVMGLHVG